MIQIHVRATDASVLEGLKRYLTNLTDDQFFGVIEIQFVNGEIALVRKQESFKPAAFLVVE